MVKVVRMHIVSLRSVNFGFWSHLGCSGKTPSYLAVNVSFRVAREKIYKYIFDMYIFNSRVKAEQDGVGSVRGKRTSTVFDFVFSLAHSL